MSYTQYFKFRKEELNEYEFSEICELVATIAVAWYHNGSHGDAYIADVRKGKLGGKFFSSNDSSGLAELWKKQKYILLFPEDQSTESLVIDFPLEWSFNFVKTYRNPDFCPLVRAVYKGLQLMGFGKASHDGYYEGIQKGNDLLKATRPELFDGFLNRAEEQFLYENPDWSIRVIDDQVEIAPYQMSGYDWSKVFVIKNFRDLCEQVQEVCEFFDPCTETYKWLDEEGHGINGAPYYMGTILADMECLEDSLNRLAKDLFSFLEEEEEDENPEQLNESN